MKNRKPTIIFIVALTAFTTYISLDTFVIQSVYQAHATEMNTSMFENVEESSDSEDASSDVEEGSDSEDATADEEKSESSHHHFPGGKPDFSDGEHDFPQRPDFSDGEHDSSKKPSGSHSHGKSTDVGTTELEVSEDTEKIGEYSDDNVDIEITGYTVNNTKVYVADVTVSSAEYLKTAFANDTYGKNVTDTTSSIAESHNAILAINGDYYGAQESGYVIRNGVVYRGQSDGEDVLCVYADGTLKIVDPSTATAEELVADGVWQAFSFGPALVEDGSISVSENDEIGQAMASNPRTAVGMVGKNHYLFVVSDGRTDESEGLSLYELADFMQSLGVKTAYNLDGGGSSTMYFDGKVVNNPTTTGNSTKERSVSDIVYIS